MAKKKVKWAKRFVAEHFKETEQGNYVCQLPPMRAYPRGTVRWTSASRSACYLPRF